MTSQQKTRTKILKWLILLGFLSAVCLLLVMLAGYAYLAPKLPDIDSLKDVRLQEPLRIYSKDGQLLAEYGEKRRIPLSIAVIPDTVKNAFLAAEDDRFEQHPGVDYQGLIRAGINQIVKGDKSQGASTITMQVARNFFLSREKTYLRKINEILLALRIERELSKDKILELYLNKIYLGKRAYGVAAAAQVYYAKTVDQLTLAQVAMIAGLPKAPSANNPLTNPERALQRRNYVLGRMLELDMIDAEQHRTASALPITAGTYAASSPATAMYLAEMVRESIVERYGEQAYTSGLAVYTTIDSRLQAVANQALSNGLLDYSQRHGYRGAIQRLEIPDSVQTILVQPEKTATDEVGQPMIGNIQRDTTAMSAEAAAELVWKLPALEVDKNLQQLGRYGPLRPALVVSIASLPTTDATENEQTETATLYLGQGQETQLTLPELLWAKRYISVDNQGPKPRTVTDVLRVGDWVWVRPVKNPTPATAVDAEASSTQGWQWALAQVPEVEGALVVMEPQTGALLALVGGFDYFKSKFNRAAQAKRQPGSSFKPFIYSAALDNGFTAASIINDAPVVFDDPALEGKWRPENYSGKFFGPTRLREGLVKSRNLVSIRLLIALGVGNARSYARRFGFANDSLPRDLSLVLGSGILTPLELATGYAVFANGGYRVEPYFIDRIEDSDGSTLWLADYALACLDCYVRTLDPVSLALDYAVEWPIDPEQTEAEQIESDSADQPGKQDDIATEPEADILNNDEMQLQASPKRRLRQVEQVIPEQTAYIMRSILRDVIQRGTGVRARVLGRSDLAGKTGTTNDQHDAWFCGFNSSQVATVWVGFDTHRPLGAREAGSRAALPVWIDYMRQALRGVPEDTISQPEGLVSIRIDAKTGLLANAATTDSLFELFRTENVPLQEADTAPDSSPYSESQTAEPDFAEDLF